MTVRLGPIAFSLITAAGLFAACSGRAPRAIQQQTVPKSATTGGTANGGVTAGGTTANETGAGTGSATSPDGAGGDPSMTGSTASATTGVPDSNVLPQVLPKDDVASMTISSPLEDGTPSSIVWDGKTYQGNAAWDLLAQ